MRLDKLYDFETCTNETTLFKMLNRLKDADLIQYRTIEPYIIQILDYDLTHDEEMELIDDLANLGVYPEEDDSDGTDMYWEDYDDFN